MAYLEFTRTTQTSITVRLADLDLTGQANKGTSRLPRHNSYQVSCLGDVRTLATGSNGYSGTATYAGLTPGTTYQIQGIVNYTDINNNTRTVNIYDECSTDEKPAPVRPGYFSWLRGFVTSKPVANELPRGGDIPPYLTADGWNTYTANINAVREYRGLWQYSFTTARRGVTRLSAAMVNEAIAAISAMSPPTSPPGRATPMVTPGSASLLNKLVDSLNSIS